MIAEITISFLAVAGFGVVFWWSRIVAVSRQATKAVMAGLSSMMDTELGDDDKEIAVRQAGFMLIIASFSIFWRFCVALAAAAVPIFAADGIGLVKRDAVFSLMMRLDYIVVVSFILIIVAEMFRRRHLAAGESVTRGNQYSAADRFFHIIAFSSPAVLKAASWLEDRVLPRPAKEDPSVPPIFITSLARGGTTALLNALYGLPAVATHTYRDMPFLTAPRLWNWLAGGQKRSVTRQQRAHGDGHEIDLDRPEAFEEVVWKMFWPEKFRRSFIALWQTEDRKPDAEMFLKHHMEKVIHARLTQRKDANSIATVCYCSKNNANIARIPFLKAVFPGCRIVVPVRRPECHAASLLRQHQNFMELQADDGFIKRYMGDIGHFEFGQIHKPIQFPGFKADAYDPATGNYWLNYWIHAYREILKYSDYCIFVLQDDLRSSPQEIMTTLCKVLDIVQGELQFSNYFHSSQDQARIDLYSKDIYEEATELYAEIERVSLSVYP